MRGVKTKYLFLLDSLEKGAVFVMNDYSAATIDVGGGTPRGSDDGSVYAYQSVVVVEVIGITVAGVVNEVAVINLVVSVPLDDSSDQV